MWANFQYRPIYYPFILSIYKGSVGQVIVQGKPSCEGTSLRDWRYVAHVSLLTGLSAVCVQSQSFSFSPLEARTLLVSYSYVVIRNTTKLFGDVKNSSVVFQSHYFMWFIWAKI